ncbi:MAG TPA: hypothetical protein VFG20_11345 [Planctomycetaceae bacterium]|nr:hypothetical protein [Planctomycetaceae bacterium]
MRRLRQRSWFFPILLATLCGLRFASSLDAAELFVGAASVSITPDRPVALWGQLHTRISQGVESPVTANVVALESRDGQSVLDQAFLVSCDLVAIPEEVLARTRDRVKALQADFPVQKIVLSATHTHTAPVLMDGLYDIPTEGVMQPAEYVEFFAERTAGAILKAWTARQPCQVSWGSGQAMVAHNRRAVYADGSAAMYGRTDGANFRMIEGYEDHDLNALFFWNQDNQLIATAINVACPAQEVEGRSAVNADFWHPVRESLRARFGSDLVVLGWTGAAGDQSPRPMFRKAAEERMRKLRGLDRLNDLARVIVRGWDEAYEGAIQDRHRDVPLVHHVEQLELPRREVTEREWQLAKASEADSAKEGKKTLVWWHGRVVKRYEQQQAGAVPPYVMELHVLRLGDIAIATNAFELFTDYGIQIKARSPALQTFVVQLTGPGSYLASERAVQGGGYSAIVQSNEVGPEAGRILVDQTVDRLQQQWQKKP